MALNTANTLNGHYSRLATSVERLSTGLRVNSSADDAAGLAIRELMRADIAATAQGVRNANDAISLIQVADGALSIIDEKLIRMKELAEQAATGTYDSTQRLMIDSEFQAMASEIERIARATDFNGIKLLDGSRQGEHDGRGLEAAGRLKIHFGTGNDSAEDYYYLDIADCTLAGLGLRDKNDKMGGINAFNIPVERMTNSLESRTVLNGEHKYTEIGFGPDFSELNDYSSGKATHVLVSHNPRSIFDVNMNEGEWVCTADEDNTECPNGLLIIPAGTKNFVFNQVGAAEHTTQDNDIQLFTMDGKHLAGTYPVPDYNTFGAIQDEACDLAAGCNYIGFTINQYDASYINVGPAKYDKGQTLFFTSYNGMNIGFSNDATQNYFTPYVSYEVLTIDEVTEDLYIWLPGQAGALFKYYTDNYQTPLPPNPPDPQNPDNPLPQGEIISIKTQEKAQQALTRIDDAIVAKDKVRAHLGAMQNRLENTVTNLSIQGENLQTAESRISDTDVATEMTQFVRNQVLTQSAVAMLGQANSYPHMLAGLLNG